MSKLQEVKAKATVMTDEEQAHIRANDKLLLSTNKETLVCMLLSAFLRIDADRAAASGDVVAMIRAFKAMQEIES